MAMTSPPAGDPRRQQQAERIRELRRRLHLSQQDIALKVGVSVRAYADWEKGRADPIGDKGGNLVRLAKALNTSPDYIEYGVARQPTPTAMANWSVEKRLSVIEDRLAVLDTIIQREDAIAERLDRIVAVLAKADAVSVLKEMLAAESEDGPREDFLSGPPNPGADGRPSDQGAASAGRLRRRTATHN